MPKKLKASFHAGGGDEYEFEYDPGTGPLKHGNELRWQVAHNIAVLSSIANWLARGDYFQREGDERPFWDRAAADVQEVADDLAEATGGVMKQEPPMGHPHVHRVTEGMAQDAGDTEKEQEPPPADQP